MSHPIDGKRNFGVRRVKDDVLYIPEWESPYYVTRDEAKEVARNLSELTSTKYYVCDGPDAPANRHNQQEDDAEPTSAYISQ